MVRQFLWCVILAVLAIHPTYAASSYIKLSTDTQTVYLGDIIVINVESTGLQAPLDVSKWQANDAFLRETTGTRIAVIGGKVAEIKIRRMEFISDTVGQHIYGPLVGEGAGEQLLSNSVAVSVLPAADKLWQASVDDYSATMTLSNSTPYIGQQLVLDIELQHKYPISGEIIQLPTLENLDVLPIYEARRTTVDNKEGFQQTAWRYLVHPNKSGQINLDNLQWSGTFVRSRTQRGEFEAEVSGIQLNVKPAASINEQWWLPANSVVLQDEWSKEVTQLSAGEQVLRTITLEATGVLSSQLPEITPLESRAISSTLISTEREQKLEGTQTRSRAKFIYRMTAQSPIPVFLDTVRVAWWDVNQDEARESIIPARRINIGLPERAELLADLALNESYWARWYIRLAAAKNLQYAALLLAAFLVALLCLPLLIRIRKTVSLAVRKRYCIFKIRQNAKQGQWRKLYLQLQKLTPNDLPAKSERSNTITLIPNSSLQALRNCINEQLFSTKPTVVNQQLLEESISGLTLSSFDETTIATARKPSLRAL